MRKTMATSIDHANKLIDIMNELKAELDTWVNKGRKASAKRARKHTLAFQQTAKDFRRMSVQECSTKKGADDTEEGGE